jgi:N-methylhydantoinase A
MIRLAAAAMMRAIRAVTVERGRDPRDFALLAFGGNGPLFATAIAEALGIARIIVPPLPGVFSAFGLLVARMEHHLTRSLRARLPGADPAPLRAALAALDAEAGRRLQADGFPPARQTLRRAALARYLGQSSEIPVPLPDGADWPAALPERFAQAHEATYGFRADAGEPVELMGLAVTAAGLGEAPLVPAAIPPAAAPTPARRRAWFPESAWVETRVTDRAGLRQPAHGPLIVQEYDATTLVPAGWDAALDAFGAIRLRHRP